MNEFEKLLEKEKASIIRFVRFRINSKADADDLLQDIFLTAYQKFFQLKNKDSFKSWIISIAKNKCKDYYRKNAARLEISIDAFEKTGISGGRYGIEEINPVTETLNCLGNNDKQILNLFFWKDMAQAEIASLLHIPVGTVKSRLHTAKQHFKDKYLYLVNIDEGDFNMKKLPILIPQYKIEESLEKPFPVKCEEIPGWFLIPKSGEKLTFGLYDIPSRKCSNIYEMQVTGKAKIHGIEGTELMVTERHESKRSTVYTFVVQLTDTHCRYLAIIRNNGDFRNYVTFLDGDEFSAAWGIGEDNCGIETNLKPKGDIKRINDIVTAANKKFLTDIVGRYTITIGSKCYDTVCLMEIDSYNCDVISEKYLDQNGRTILWRRFNRDDWAINRYKKKWSEQLPKNDKIIVNGSVYVHWYDCITDYIC